MVLAIKLYKALLLQAFCFILYKGLTISYIIRNRGFLQNNYVTMEGIVNEKSKRGKNCLYRMCKGTLFTSFYWACV